MDPPPTRLLQPQKSPPPRPSQGGSQIWQGKRLVLQCLLLDSVREVGKALLHSIDSARETLGFETIVANALCIIKDGEAHSLP